MAVVAQRKQRLTSVQIPLEVYQLLKELAEAEQRSVASYARQLIIAQHARVFGGK